LEGLIDRSVGSDNDRVDAVPDDRAAVTNVVVTELCRSPQQLLGEGWPISGVASVWG
jgi:hypothetical protein